MHFFGVQGSIKDSRGVLFMSLGLASVWVSGLGITL